MLMPGTATTDTDTVATKGGLSLRNEVTCLVPRSRLSMLAPKLRRPFSVDVLHSCVCKMTSHEAESAIGP